MIFSRFFFFSLWSEMLCLLLEARSKGWLGYLLALQETRYLLALQETRDVGGLCWVLVL